MRTNKSVTLLLLHMLLILQMSFLIKTNPNKGAMMNQNKILPTKINHYKQVSKSPHLDNNNKLNRQTLVCFSHLRWNFVYQRPQHLMTRFAAIYSYLF